MFNEVYDFYEIFLIRRLCINKLKRLIKFLAWLFLQTQKSRNRMFTLFKLHLLHHFYSSPSFFLTKSRSYYSSLILGVNGINIYFGSDSHKFISQVLMSRLKDMKFQTFLTFALCHQQRLKNEVHKVRRRFL